jgi:hypothetical protein
VRVTLDSPTAPADRVPPVSAAITSHMTSMMYQRSFANDACARAALLLPVAPAWRPEPHNRNRREVSGSAQGGEPLGCGLCGLCGLSGRPEAMETAETGDFYTP